MTLFQMASTIAACDAALVLEGLDEDTRGRILERLGKALADIAIRNGDFQSERDYSTRRSYRASSR